MVGIHISNEKIEQRIESTFVNVNLDLQKFKSFNVLRIVFQRIDDTSSFLDYKRCQEENN